MRAIQEPRSIRSTKIILISATLLCFILWGTYIVATHKWTQAKGYEYEWIAGALASGHGYSFDIGSAWLGPYTNVSGYSPTAWCEPVQTLIIALSFIIFGDRGRLFLVLVNSFWLALTSLVIFRISTKLFGILTGAISIGLFIGILAIKSDQLLYIGNASSASFLISLCALALMELLDDFSLKNSIILGISLGLASLTHAGTLLFAPIFVLIILLKVGRPKLDDLKNIAILLSTFLIVLFPWSLRNHMVFSRIIPVRNGFGWQLYLGNLGIAAAVGNDLGENFPDTDPPWLASSIHQAVGNFKLLEFESLIRNYLFSITETQLPATYSSFNEAQRDRFFLQRAMSFIVANPFNSIKQMVWKTLGFFYWGFPTAIITILAFAGWFAGIKNFKVQSLMLMVGAYASPYILSLPLYYRYRFPIEPMIVILAAAFMGSIINFSISKVRIPG